jgi:hypothetical protein
MLQRSEHNRAARRWLRPRMIILTAVAVALAIGVPVAWATFTDVPPSNPFYDDINAIQGAGITQGCGGGNFCPTDNITRQAEAAFQHRTAGRTAYNPGNEVALGSSGFTDMGGVTVDIGGTAGQTQFVVLNAAVTTYIQSTAGCPCLTAYVIVDNAGNPLADFHYNMNDTVTTSGAFSGFGLATGAATATVAVPTATSQTFHVFGEVDGGTGSVSGYGELTALTAPFGSTGANTLSVGAGATKKGPIAAGRK